MYEMNDDLYGSSSHTNRDVPLFVHNFNLQIKNHTIPQNTIVFDICKTLLKL